VADVPAIDVADLRKAWADVEAVRRGLRIAFSRASRPVTLLIRAAGQVRSRAAGRAISGLSIATPMNTRNAATPTTIAPSVPLRLPNSPTNNATRPSTPSTRTRT